MPNKPRPMTLTEFLLARIAEDEARATAVLGESPDNAAAQRVRDECEARTEIVKLHHEVPPTDVLRWLALPYAAHPDYRQEWRP